MGVLVIKELKQLYEVKWNDWNYVLTQMNASNANKKSTAKEIVIVSQLFLKNLIQTRWKLINVVNFLWNPPPTMLMLATDSMLISLLHDDPR